MQSEESVEAIGVRQADIDSIDVGGSVAELIRETSRRSHEMRIDSDEATARGAFPSEEVKSRVAASNRTRDVPILMNGVMTLNDFNQVGRQVSAG